MKEFFEGLFSIKASKGLSLIEVGIAMLITSVALVPLVASSGGKTDSPNHATVVEASRDQSRNVVAANTLMEKAMSGQLTVNGYTGFGTYDPNSLPAGGSYTSPVWQYDVNGDIWYQWVIRDVSYRQNDQGDFVDTWGNVLSSGEEEKARIAPKSNRVFATTLRMYGSQASGVPSLVLPSFVFQQTGNVDDPDIDKTGIVLAVDSSCSMGRCKSTHLGTINLGNNKRLYSPWLKDRYFRTDIPPSHPASLDYLNDSELDTVFLNIDNDDDPDTAFDDRYLNRTLGSGPALGNDCFGSGYVPGVSDTAANIIAAADDFFTGGSFLNSNGATWKQRRAFVYNLCQSKTAQAQSDNIVDNNLSRLEAARAAMLTFIVSTEGNQFLMSNIALGMVSFGDAVRTDAPMEEGASFPDPLDNGEMKLRFENVRKKVLMINRDDTDSSEEMFKITCKTKIYTGLEEADSALNPGAPVSGMCRQHSDNNPYQQKIVILLTDGAPYPNSYPNNKTGLTEMASCMGNNKTTIHTIGLIGGKDDVLQNIASATPDGQYFKVESASDLRFVFETLAYQIERAVLLNISDRYNLNLD